MADKKRGYVKIYRSIEDHWIWRDEPFTKGQAWIDILLSVNHKDNDMLLRNSTSVITIHAGQMWTSVTNLSRKWGWSKNRVLRYLKLLKNEGMIRTDGTARGTLLTVVNYGKFALDGYTVGDADGDAGEDADGYADGDASGTRTRMNKNVKNEKNEKEKERGSCPGKGWYWSDIAERWMPPPTGGGEWQ